ncbi:DNA primase-polymerase protein [Ochrobactrum phage vB_OspP_OH]|uniref:DNA primase-polymerase protein n=1 Tax=Ochrobactrum phage vB_OspP_OH TaxID=2712957 RepID=A0A6G6XYK9_9CAUD|nr:DNA primase-polymerase protein [Ochrobactrum phage vB_OspP_OH]QIG66078.1 DNA primase-polymerase protein [Ochrobactrum phage vB_OspP_OH]
MAFKSVTGGYEISAEDRALLYEQRAITKQVNDKFIQVGANFLKTSSKNPYDEDGWAKKGYRDTDLQTWIDDPDLLHHNAGFNMQQGWVDVDIDASDPEYNKCILAAMRHMGIDTRFKFGRRSVGVATHVFVQLGEEEAKSFELLKKFEPREFRLEGQRYHTNLRSYATTTGDSKNITREARQTVVAGSIYSHKRIVGAYDLSVWYSDSGIAHSLADIAATTPRRASFNDLVRAIAFGTFLYIVKDEWVEGSRQITAQKITGFLSRVVKDSFAMNNHDGIAADVFCPVDDLSIAESLIAFICDYQGDDEKHMRIRALNDAAEKLDRNPDAKIPGWPAMEQLFGMEGTLAMRAVLMPGSDVSQLTKMAERYVYDESNNTYIDRERFLSGANYVHDGSELERRHKGDVVRIGGKPREAFKVFESSDMRKRVGISENYPNLPAGSIHRITVTGTILSDDADRDPTELTVFNTWRGWPIAPTAKVDEALMADCVAKLDRVLGLITRDNVDQINWMKDWIAWIFQHPDQKQQIAPVVVGDQGVGKSWLGNVFMKALMGSLWGTASPTLMEGAFSVEPFINKMFVFIDEAKFSGEQSVEEIKKIIRNVDVSGAEKFKSARDYRIFARVMFASNRLNLNIGQQNVRDRALFYMRTYDKAHKNMNEMEFRTWAETLKPFFDEYTAFMQRLEVKEHYVRYFMDRPVDRHSIESISKSSASDKEIVDSNMSWARRVAKEMIEDGRVFEDLDITTPFNVHDFNTAVHRVAQTMGLGRVQGAQVLHELQQAGVITECMVGMQRKQKFTKELGGIMVDFAVATGITMEPRYELNQEKDFGENTWKEGDRRMWRGSKVTSVVL